jgi:hypothetical protein
MIYSAAAIAAAPVAYFANRAPVGMTALLGSVGLGIVVYLILLMAFDQVGRQDLQTLKRALLTRASHPKALGAADPASS